MKRLRNALIYLLVFLTALLFFVPKENLYYLAERQAEPFGAVLDGETLNDRLFLLDAQGGTLFVKGIESASVGTLSFRLFGLYNRIDVTELRLAQAYGRFFPPEVDSIRVVHALWDPLHLRIEAEGAFGTAQAVVSLASRHVEATLQPSETLSAGYAQTLRYLEKDESGGYRYATDF